MNICLVRVVEFFNEPSLHPRDVIPSFELITIASLIRKDGHTPDYIDNEILKLSVKDMEKKLLRKHYDVYIFHFQPVENDSISKLINKLKSKTKSLILAFGPSVDFQTIDFIKQSKVDIALIGEPEIAAVEIINDIAMGESVNFIKRKNILGTAYLFSRKIVRNNARPLLNPDELPMLAHDLVDPNRYRVVSKKIIPKGKIRWGFMLTSRGCPYNCTFCAPSIRNSIGKPFRSQTVKRTVDEIEYLISNNFITALSFEDDIFTYDDQRVVGICEEIIRRKISISWTAATRLDRLNESTARLMRKAGCTGLSAGVESGSDRILKMARKGVTTEGLLRGAQILHRCGIALTANFIVGHPSETYEDLKLTMKFIKQVKPVFIHLHFMTPYPGTELFTQYHDQLKAFTTFSHWRIHEFNVSAMKSEDLQRAVSKMYKSYYLSPSYIYLYIKHRLRYWINDPSYELNFVKSTVRYLFNP